MGPGGGPGRLARPGTGLPASARAAAVVGKGVDGVRLPAAAITGLIPGSGLSAKAGAIEKGWNVIVVPATSTPRRRSSAIGLP